MGWHSASGKLSELKIKYLCESLSRILSTEPALGSALPQIHLLSLWAALASWLRYKNILTVSFQKPSASCSREWVFGIRILESNYFHAVVITSLHYLYLWAAVDFLPFWKKLDFIFFSCFSFNKTANSQAMMCCGVADGAVILTVMLTVTQESKWRNALCAWDSRSCISQTFEASGLVIPQSNSDIFFICFWLASISSFHNILKPKQCPSSAIEVSEGRLITTSKKKKCSDSHLEKRADSYI